MGRAKLTLELRNNHKARRVTFEKRRKGLEKKAHELSTLCGVKIGMIIYRPAEGDEPVEPTIWPENREEIENLISSYKKRSDDDCRQKTYDLSFFFTNKVKKVQEELVKTRNKNIETKYPTWDASYDNLTYDELKHFSSLLQAKIENVKSRINLMNQNQMNAQSVQENIYVYQCKLDYQQQQSLMPHGSFNMDDPRLMMMPMNDGASSSSSNYIYNAEDTYGNYTYSNGGEIRGNYIGSEIPVSHGLGFGILDNVPFPNAEMCCYLPNLYPMPQYKQFPVFSSPTLQLQVANTEDYRQRHDFQLLNPM
ncbi:agamous-like MADS-box protein AGL11 [Olea europaea var. sylvestris]|uniref:Agamous-like MADS-box AGL82 n=1 Tax=Olea europaea subsp. europaea TaxID=158383 RepID=A0A8S0U349_OLEEU|nr:agamous-like MADS-box protein AGL11 [Olea europaea var. sylvestris]CAA3010539.1 agamous-like MADS-box AGL82 [Olea europaea subsp. europaea]